MLVLPGSMREEMRRPFGKLVSGKIFKEELAKAEKPLISVGDRCAYDLIAQGTPPDMLVVDFKVKREEIPPEMKKAIATQAKNALLVFSGAGMITDELQKAIDAMLLEGRGAVIVIGEDDLSSLLIMANAKKGTLVYGQPGKGAVLVPLGGEKIRKTAQGILGRMEKG
ncbi:MAG: DUF359 domain-containing protein [Candidatus Micrarchaeia archaeon]